jgi:hypothetical protein
MPIQIYRREGVGSLLITWGGVCSGEFQKPRGQTRRKRWSFVGRRPTLCKTGWIWREDIGVRFKLRSVHERMLGRPVVCLKRGSARTDGRATHRFAKTMVVFGAAPKLGKHVVTHDLSSPGVAGGVMPIQIYRREGVGSLPITWGGVCSGEFQKPRGQTCSSA